MTSCHESHDVTKSDLPSISRSANVLFSPFLSVLSLFKVLLVDIGRNLGIFVYVTHEHAC